MQDFEAAVRAHHLHLAKAKTSFNTSNGPHIDRRRSSGASHSVADVAPVREQQGTFGMLLPPQQPHKRPRLDMQFQRGTPTLPSSQAGPLYNFVNSNGQTAFVPVVSSYGQAAYSSVPSSTMSAPQAVTPFMNSPHLATPPGSSPLTTMSNVNPRQVFSPLTSASPKASTPNSHPGNISAHASMQSLQRRHSGQSTLSSSGGQNPMNQTQTVTHTENWRQQPAQHHASAAAGTLQQAGMLRIRTSTLRHLPRLKAIIADPQTKPSFTDWARQRVVLLEEACNCEDWFYLTLHQIYCWASLNRTVLPQLGFTPAREHALASLEAILIPNTQLQPMALEWLSQFPTNPLEILRGSNADASAAIDLMHAFLDKLSQEWSQLSGSCLVRKYPPSPYELHARLGMSSTVLQKVFFTFIFRQIEGGDNQSWVDYATQFFNFTQSQLVEKFNRIKLGLSEAPPNLDTGLAQFASEYFALRNKHASRPVLPTNVGVSVEVAEPSLRSTPTAPEPTPSATSPIVRTSADRNGFTPATSPGRPPGVFSGLSNAATGTRTQYPRQPLSNSMQPTMGPRQQDFVQEITGTVSMLGTPYANTSRRSSGLSNTLLQSSAGSTSSHPNLPRGNIPRVQAPSRNVAAIPGHMTSHIATITRLLPLAGKLMTINTHPNPDILGLHQARLLSPEPRIITDSSQPMLPRLYQVLQHFVLSPQLIAPGRSYYEWRIDLPAEDAVRKAYDTPVPASRPTSKSHRIFKQGSMVYRLRCVVKPGASQTAPTETEWATAITHWPSSCLISLNESEIDTRRKSHHGRNLPCDLTAGIKEGTNTIEMSVHLGPEEMSHTFAVAIEQIECLDHAQCTKELTLIERPVSLANILKSLHRTVGDDQIAIVDPHISIDLIDPFTAQIWKIPVRGKNCTHRECFDLEAFLDSRPNKVKGVFVSSADEWRCPICNKDARPQCLVLDGFLLDVSQQLAKQDDRDEVRAIQVVADGSWKPARVEKQQQQPERESTRKEAMKPAISARSTPSKDAVIREARMEHAQAPVIIELDDDD